MAELLVITAFTKFVFVDIWYTPPPFSDAVLPVIITFVFEPKGLLNGINATCHPACQSPLGDRFNGKRVSVTDNIITSQGPGTAMEFALKLVELGLGKTKRDEIAEPMITQ